MAHLGKDLVETRPRGRVVKPGRTAAHPRWWAIEEPDALATEVCAIVSGLVEDQRTRHAQYLHCVSLYEGRPLSGLNAWSYDSADKSYDEISIPLHRSLCDTVQADIAGRQRPKPTFMTAGADWKTRRRAKALDRFVEATLHQPQGSYTNGWELTVDTYLDAPICGIGCLKVFVRDGRVCLERVPPGRVLVDSREAETGAPQNFFEQYPIDEDKLLEEFVDGPEDIDDETREKRRSAIESAASYDPGMTTERYGSTRIARSVLVREAIRLPIGPKKPGKHVICVPGCVLYEAEWTRGSEPYVWFRWARERVGFWATGLIQESASLVAETNRTFGHMQERMVLCANKRTYVKKDTVPLEALQTNEIENIIEWEGDQPPIEIATPALTGSDVEWASLCRQLVFESTGVSMMSATSRKEQDVTAGIAIRTLIDVASKRFSVKARYGYEFPFVALARQIVSACAEYVEATGEDIVVPYPGVRGGQEIRWSSVQMDLRSVLIQIAPASSLAQDLAGRMSTIQELYGGGVISQTTFLRLLDWPDLQRELDTSTAEYEYISMLVDRYLDADPEDTETPVYEPPDGFIIGKEAALLQVSREYFLAKRDGAPEYNLRFLRDYMLGLGELIERGMAPPAPPPGAQTTPPQMAEAGALPPQAQSGLAA